MTQPAFNFNDPLDGLELSLRERVVAERVMRATSKSPVRIKDLRAELAEKDLHTSERAVKGIVRTLRKEHQLRILARREQPAGYYWCECIEDMREFIQTFSGQWRDEAHTLGRVVRANYPELAGQLSISLGDYETL